MLRFAARRTLRCSSQFLPCLHPRHARSFFGVGEIVGVLANPAETIRQLKESRELLSKAREEANLKNESKRIPKKHTFSKLPGFHGRKTELAMLRKVLGGNPQLNLIFGATSVGKTALMREVLAGDDFYVIQFDLRISGFADLRTLYYTLSEQFQLVFQDMKDEETDMLAISFKHLILQMEEREKKAEYKVSVADIADLMETLQSCLLRYWRYDPKAKLEAERKKEEERNGENMEEKDPPARKINSRTEVKDIEDEKLFKKKPIVFLIDECHKLPALVNDELSLKVFLDTLLVLTKQDRLCHVILATSDAFFQHFLRIMNVGHHAQIITIGDCTREETYSYFMDEIMPTVPENLRSKVDFDEIYEAFGGKLSHIADYMSVWVNYEGELTPLKSAIFTQAYTLLQFHLTHETLETFSPLSTATAWTNSEDADNQFTRKDLLYVMRQLVQPPYSLPYFDLCRKIGTAKADAMVKTRVLDLRWTRTLSPEQDWVERVWSKDGIERPILLPMTRIVRRAMEVCLMEEDRRDKALEHE